jgi:putative Holliday junction resolvase
MRIMGLDVGSKTIGVALSDPLGWTAQPLEVIRRTTHKEDRAAVARLARTHDVTEMVVGLPRNMDGSEGSQAMSVRQFVGELAKVLPLPTVFVDERLTTVQAERRLREMEVRREKRKAIIDRQAAALILQIHLDRRLAQPSPPPDDLLPGCE